MKESCGLDGVTWLEKHKIGQIHACLKATRGNLELDWTALDRLFEAFYFRLARGLRQRCRELVLVRPTTIAARL